MGLADGRRRAPNPIWRDETGGGKIPSAGSVSYDAKESCQMEFGALRNVITRRVHETSGILKTA